MLLVPDEIPVCYNLPFKIAISLLSKKKRKKKKTISLKFMSS